MQKLLMPLFILLSVSCSTSVGNDKPLTKNIPSTDKTVLRGETVNNGRSHIAQLNRNQGTQKYNVVKRLYGTVWYQTEKDWDDGKLETETEFVFFENKPGSIPRLVEREMENGKIETPDADDYKLLKVVETGLGTVTRNPKVLDPKANNAAIVSVKEPGDNLEYEGYYLEDKKTLFIVEGDSQSEVKFGLKGIIDDPSSPLWLKNKYTLSTSGLKR